jgi:hypothetical protein
MLRQKETKSKREGANAAVSIQVKRSRTPENMTLSTRDLVGFKRENNSYAILCITELGVSLAAKCQTYGVG